MIQNSQAIKRLWMVFEHLSVVSNFLCLGEARECAISGSSDVWINYMVLEAYVHTFLNIAKEVNVVV